MFLYIQVEAAAKEEGERAKKTASSLGKKKEKKVIYIIQVYLFLDWIGLDWFDLI